MNRAYFGLTGSPHGCFLTFPWHLRICSGEQSSGLPFISFGLSHFVFRLHIACLLFPG